MNLLQPNYYVSVDHTVSTTGVVPNSTNQTSELTNFREEVAKLYVATFNRAPDATGLDYWVNDSRSFFERSGAKLF